MYTYFVVLHDSARLDWSYSNEHTVELLLGHALRQIIDDKIRPRVVLHLHVLMLVGHLAISRKISSRR